MAYQMVLQGTDASRLSFVCRNPALAQDQESLECHMQPNEYLLDALVTLEVISQVHRQQILNDISQQGKVKRILLNVDRCEDGPTKLVDALKQSESDANATLAQELEQTLHDLSQQSALA